MATHKSAEKRARQAIKRSARNGAAKNALKTFEKTLKKALSEKDAKKATEALRKLTSRFDKAAQKGVMHAKTASRKIGRLSRQVSALLGK